jgi:hypothetical protein
LSASRFPAPYPAATSWSPAHEKIAGSPGFLELSDLRFTWISRIEESDPIRISHMEAERINQIGNQLTDLSARTAALRGYL